jgi:hypothetical protein
VGQFEILELSLELGQVLTSVPPEYYTWLKIKFLPVVELIGLRSVPKIP